MIRTVLMVGAGGALGSMARFLSQRFISMQAGTAFPLGTLLVNITGCFLIGIFWGWGMRNASLSAEWRTFLMAGFCGGFTTFSAFTLEGITLLKDQRLGMFFLYIGLSVMAGLAATWLGIRLIK